MRTDALKKGNESMEDGFAKNNRRSAAGGRRNAGRQEVSAKRGSRYDGHSYPDGDAYEDDADYLDADFDDDAFADELDIFDEIDLGRGDAQDDESIADDADMEEKLLGQAMAPREEQPFSDGGSTARDARGRSAAGRETPQRKSPRELNTAGSTVDQKKLRTEREQKKKSRVKTVLIWMAVELFTLLAIFGYAYIARNLSRMGHTEVDKAVVENENLTMEKKKEMEGYWNFYIFGVDNRDGRVSRGNSDVIMIASINQDTGDIRLVSVFRDTYLNVSSKNSYNKINQAYAQGGPEQAIAALNKNLDLNITNYVTVNWDAVAHGINILGGIDDVDISKAELYYINAFITETVKSTGIGSVQLKTTGPQHLDGVQAVAYGRLRLMDNDFARTERQREVIEKAFAKAKKADFAVLNNILVDCFPMVAIDIPFSDLARMAQSISKYNIAETAGFPWQRGDANIPGKGACVIPTSLESNVTRLHEFLFGDTDYQPSEAVRRYSQKIKEDSNLYKEGKPIESVGTDNGVIQKSKTNAVSGSASDEAETKKTSGTAETDKYGNTLYETDEYGKEIRETDEDGNPVHRETRPTSVLETEGDAGSEIVDDAGNVVETRPHKVNPTGTTAATKEQTNPDGTQETKKPAVNPTGTTAAKETTEAANGPTSPSKQTETGGRPTEIQDEPQFVAPGVSSHSTQPETSAATVISPTKPAPTLDNSGPGAALSPQGPSAQDVSAPGTTVIGPAA